jgi:hypothetical protein
MLTKYYSSDQIEKGEMGGACSINGEEERYIQVGKPEEKDHLEDPGIDRRIILRWIFRYCDGVMGNGLD